MKSKTFKSITMLSMLLALTACKGGGSNSNETSSNNTSESTINSPSTPTLPEQNGESGGITTDIPDGYQPFSLVWDNPNSNEQQIVEGTTGIFNFSTILGSSPLESFSYNVVIKKYGVIDSTLISNLDIKNQTLYITVPFGGYASYDYTGKLIVNDGISINVLDFIVKAKEGSGYPSLDLPQSFYLEEGKTKTIKIIAPKSNNQNSVKVNYIDFVNGSSEFLDYQINNENKEITFTALQGSSNKGFLLNIHSSDDSFSSSNNYLNIYIKKHNSDIEDTLLENYNYTVSYLEQASEYEKLGDFLIDYLEILNVFNKEEARSEKLRLYDNRWKENRSIYGYMNCVKNTLSNGYVHWSYDSYIDNDKNLLCDVTETTTLKKDKYGRQDGSTTENHYANITNNQAAMTKLNNIRNYANTDIEPNYGTIGIYNHINYLIARIKQANPNFIMPEVQGELMTEISDNLNSRFIGNHNYGRYNNGKWEFYPEFSILGASSAMALKTIQF